MSRDGRKHYSEQGAMRGNFDSKGARLQKLKQNGEPIETRAHKRQVFFEDAFRADIPQGKFIHWRRSGWTAGVDLAPLAKEWVEELMGQWFKRELGNHWRIAGELWNEIVSERAQHQAVEANQLGVKFQDWHYWEQGSYEHHSGWIVWTFEGLRTAVQVDLYVLHGEMGRKKLEVGLTLWGLGPSGQRQEPSANPFCLLLRKSWEPGNKLPTPEDWSREECWGGQKPGLEQSLNEQEDGLSWSLLKKSLEWKQ